MGIFRFILILPVSALTIETAVYRTVRTLRCERTGVNLPLLLDSDFSPKVPFIGAGEDFIGPFKFVPEWSADTCRKISRPVTKTPGKCPLIGESKDSFAQPCGNCPVSSEGISISTTKAQKENGYGKKDIR
jgi:hypothetical protein